MNEPLIARDLTLQSFVRRALRVRSDLALEIDDDCLFIANIIVLLVSDIFINTNTVRKTNSSSAADDAESLSW
jgi:hypothetical protein